MNKIIFLPLVSLFLSTAASANEISALAQLGLEPEPAIDFSINPSPVPVTKGDVTHQIAPWDPNAPFLYCELPSEVSYLPGAAVIKNMRWGAVPADKKTYIWETATIKPELLDKVFFAYKTAGVGHSLFIFVFKDGGLVNSLGEKAPAFTAGAEGWSREPYGYNAFHASMGKYPLFWSITTLSNYLEYTTVLRASDLYITPMALDRAQSLALLEKTLERVNQTNARHEIYESFKNNCTTNPVDLLNAVVAPALRISRKAFLGLPNPDFTFPRFAVDKYTELGLISPDAVKLDAGNYASFDITAL